MQATFRSAELLMHKGQTLELGDAARSVITGIGGAVWLTRDGDLNDRILLPGQSMNVGRDSNVWLSAFDEARIKVEQHVPAARSLPVRLARDLRAAYLRFMRRSGRGGRAGRGLGSVY
jgi:hypothetical protein